MYSQDPQTSQPLMMGFDGGYGTQQQLPPYMTYPSYRQEKPPIGDESIVITDNRIRNGTDFQIASYWISYIAVGWIIAILLLVLPLLYQDTPSEFTYYRRGDTTCSRYYDYTTHVARWTYFIFAVVNVINVRFACNIGQKMWGALSLGPGLAALILNVGVALVVFISNQSGCNVSGNGDTGNICQNRLFCGIASVIADTTNNCLLHNPTNVALCDTSTTLENIPMDPTYIMFWVALAAIIFWTGIMSVFSYFIPVTTAVTRAVTDFVKTNLKSVENGSGLPPIDNGGAAPMIVKKRNIYDIINFFSVYKRYHVVFYFPVTLLDWLLGLGLSIWFGWFMQNVKTFERTFSFSPTSSSCSVFETVIRTENVMFYALLGVLLLAWWMQARIGNMFTNWVGIIGAALGLTFSVILFVWGGLRYWLSCNRFGQGYNINICNDRRRFCSTFGGTNSTLSYRTAAANNCPNDFDCPVSFVPSQLVVDEDFFVLLLLIISSMVVFLICLVYSVVLQLRLSKFVARRKNEEAVDEESLKQLVSESTVPNSVPQWAIPAYLKGVKYQLTGLNQFGMPIIPQQQMTDPYQQQFVDPNQQQQQLMMMDPSVYVQPQIDQYNTDFYASAPPVELAEGAIMDHDVDHFYDNIHSDPSSDETDGELSSPDDGGDEYGQVPVVVKKKVNMLDTITSIFTRKDGEDDSE